MRKLWRRLTAASATRRRIVSSVMMIVILSITLALHSLVHNRIDNVYQPYWDIQTKANADTRLWPFSRYTFVEQVSRKFLAVEVCIQGGHFRPNLPGPNMVQSQQVDDLKHICVWGDFDRQELVIGIPADQATAAWANVAPEPKPSDYRTWVRSNYAMSLEEAIDRERRADTASVSTNVLFARLALASFTTTGLPWDEWQQSMDATGRRWHYANKAMHFLPLVLLYAVLVSTLVSTMAAEGMSDIINDAMERHKLEGDEHRQRITAAVEPSWYDGRPWKECLRVVDVEARRLHKDLSNAEARRRREALRKIADENHARNLEAKAARRAERARSNMKKKNSAPVSHELAELREELKDEPSDVARVVESGFFRLLESSESLDDAAETERAELSYKIHSCTKELVGLELLSMEDLRVLGQHLRPFKRAIKREHWRLFLETFDGSDQETYAKILAAFRSENYREAEQCVRQVALAPLTTSESGTTTHHMWRLQGKRILLLGGMASLSPFYQEHLKSLGASSVEHVVDRRVAKLENTDADLIMIFWRRCDHTQQDKAKALGKPLIYLDRDTRSRFARSLLEAVRVQLPAR